MFGIFHQLRQSSTDCRRNKAGETEGGGGGERLKYSQNEDDDTSSRYQQSPWDDGSQFNLSGVQDRRADGRRRRYTIHKDDRAGKNKSSGEKFKKEEVKLQGV